MTLNEKLKTLVSGGRLTARTLQSHQFVELSPDNQALIDERGNTMGMNHIHQMDRVWEEPTLSLVEALHALTAGHTLVEKRTGRAACPAAAIDLREVFPLLSKGEWVRRG